MLLLDLLHAAISEATHEDEIAESNWDEKEVGQHPT